MRFVVKNVFSVFLILFLISLPAGAGDFPSGPIRYLVCHYPGSQADIEARHQQPVLYDALGVPVIITYKPGSGGCTCWSLVAQSSPDGYLVASATLPDILINPMVSKSAGYLMEHLEMLVIFQRIPIGLAVHKDSVFSNLQDFIEYARKNPRQLKVGADAKYSAQYFAIIHLNRLAGIELTPVIFSGPAKQMIGFLSGKVDAVMGRLTDLLTHRSEVKILAIGSGDRVPWFPEVPTFAEEGFVMFPSLERGVVIPAGMPEYRKKILEKAFLTAVKKKEYVRQMIQNGFLPVCMGSEEAQGHVAGRIELYRVLLKDVENIKTKQENK